MEKQELNSNDKYDLYGIPINRNKKVTMGAVFDWIKETAIKDEGLTVKNVGNNIIFIKGKE